ncbi:MAG: CYTH domain-containing protein [Anaerovoracaceae bacterium]
MEIELKYNIPAEGIASEIWKNKLFSCVEEKDSREEICLDAKYFDTFNCDLAKKQIAYRIRKEGERWVAALKCNGTNEGALHKRLEISIPVVNGEPDLSVFCESEMGDKLQEIVDDDDIKCVLETKFHRKRMRLDTGTGIFELSIDKGKIITRYGEEPIFEVEIELFSGETDELMELGERLQKEYNLETQELSKYARGINIIKEGKKREKLMK